MEAARIGRREGKQPACVAQRHDPDLDPRPAVAIAGAEGQHAGPDGADRANDGHAARQVAVAVPGDQHPGEDRHGDRRAGITEAGKNHGRAYSPDGGNAAVIRGQGRRPSVTRVTRKIAFSCRRPLHRRGAARRGSSSSYEASV
jgi:hypothetical protein